MRAGRALTLIVAALALLPTAARAELRGHGGPVRALAATPDGAVAISGSFDQSAIVWALDRGAALQVLRFHDGAVNAVASLPDGRFLTGGEDGRIALWRVGAPEPLRVIEGHEGPVVGLAVSPDGARAASASWDGTARVTPMEGGGARVLKGHQGNVNAVAFHADGRVVTAGYDGTLRLWPQGDDESPATITLPAPLNAVAVAADGEIVAAGADGVVRVVAADRQGRREVEAGPTPTIALALSADGATIAAASIGGSVALIDRASATVKAQLVGPGLPVWSLAFRPGSHELLTGGSDRLVRRWDVRTGGHIGPVILSRPAELTAGLTGSRGAEVFQACAACHTLTPEGGNRAGPTLHGIFGRRIASVPGYNYSEAFRRMDIVWTPQTVAELFTVGPSHYTPGTKMPEQIVTDPADRQALMQFLEETTRPR